MSPSASKIDAAKRITGEDRSMPDIILPGSGASYSLVGQPPPPEPQEVEGDVEIDITGDPEDTVELGGGPPSPGTYGPNSTGDRFRFDLQNGMLGGQGRFRAVVNRSRGVAVEAYEQRASVETQVARMAGGSRSALFSLQYSDADPNREEAGSQIEGKTGFTRIADQNLELLNLL